MALSDAKVLLLVACFLAAPALGDSPARPVVLLMGPASEAEALGELASALEAQLSDLDIDVGLRLVERVPAETAAQFALVRDVGQAEGLLSAVWVQRTAGELIVFVADGRSEKLTAHALPRSGGSWRTDCDAVATSVRSLLLPWLGQDSGPVPAPPPPEPGPAPAATGGAPPGSEPASPPPSAAGIPVDLSVAVGFTAWGIDPARHWMHGVALSLGAVIGRFLEVGAGLTVLPALDMGIPGRDVRLTRWPLELGATGLLPLAGGRLELGLRLGLLLDLTAVTGLEPGAAPDETDAARLSFSPSGLLGFRLVPGLWAWVAAGAVLSSRDREYLWDDEPVLRSRAVQPRFGLGLGFRLPAGG
jgi:hypothetical protein